MEDVKDTYKISCNLEGHEQDVRAVAVAYHPEGAIVSGSRDATARLWIPNEGEAPFIEGNLFNGHSNFVSSVCCMPPEEKFPHGVIVTGSNDNTILGFTLDSLQPVFKLEGHGDTVCALSAGKFGSLLSGSWDATAKVWLNQKCVMTLTGHEAAVWAVAIMPEGGYMLTGSADKTIKLWRAGKCQQTFKGHTDCVRGVAVLSGSEFLSCSNDATVRRWQTSGACTHTYYGHTNFVYSLAVFPDGNSFASGGEDRTLRVWKDGECVQTLTHPTQSVWSVCVLPNGDIVTGSSDGIVRIFTKSKDRQAPAEMQKQFEEQLAASTIPAQIGDLKTEDLVGPDSLLNPGKHDGQNLMVRDGNTITAHQWVAAEGKWQKIGDVVGGSGGSQASSGKQLYKGKEYDYVFDVDIQEDKPPLKLPYNASEDPWMAAHNFLADNEISQMYLDQVAKFIMEQTKGVTLGQEPQPGGVDPFTGGGRYLPGTDTTSGGGVGGGVDPFTGGSRYNPNPTPDVSFNPRTTGPPDVSSMGDSMFPHSAYLTFEAANVKAISSKLEEFNNKVSDKIDAGELSALGNVLQSGESTASVTPTLQKLMQWPSENLFPVLDVLRLVVKEENGNRFFCDGAQGDEFIQYILKQLDPSLPAANQMLGTRILCNAFKHSWGERLLMKTRDDVIVAMLNCRESSNKNVHIALSTVLLNLAVAYRVSDEFEDRVAVLSAASMVVPSLKDPEARYRLLVCIGTLITVCDKTNQLAKSLDIKDVVQPWKTIKDPIKVGQCAMQVLAALS